MLLYVMYGKKFRNQDAFTLFDPGSTHNFVLQDMVAKLNIHSLEMGSKEKAKGAFEGNKFHSFK